MDRKGSGNLNLRTKMKIETFKDTQITNRQDGRKARGIREGDTKVRISRSVSRS